MAKGKFPFPFKKGSGPPGDKSGDKGSKSTDKPGKSDKSEMSGKDMIAKAMKK